MTKHCQMSVAAAQVGDTPSPLDRYCIVALKFWRENISHVYSRDLYNCIPPFTLVYSHAIAMSLAVVIFLGKIVLPIECLRRTDPVFYVS